MHLPTKDTGVRPAGSPDKCFYCGSPVGEHRSDCVVNKRTVVLEMTVRYVAEVPQSWTEDDIEFHRNDSSYCLSNDVFQLIDEIEADCCPCHRAEVRYVREADEHDHAELGYDDTHPTVQ